MLRLVATTEVGQHRLGEMNDNGDGFADLCFEQPGYLKECLPAQKDIQGNLCIT